MCLDGKTLCETIPLGESQEVHLLTAFVPEQGVVLIQVQVNGAFDEPQQAPALHNSFILPLDFGSCLCYSGVG